MPFDLKRLEVTGDPAPVLDGVKSSPNSGMGNFVVSDTGSLVYLPENGLASDGILMWVDRRNQATRLTAPARVNGTPQISPDGQRVAVAIFSGNKSDIWVYEIPRGTLTRLTFDEHSIAPLWSPDALSRFGNASYDVSADGQRFLLVKANAENRLPDEVRVVLNWNEELKRLAPSSKQP